MAAVWAEAGDASLEIARAQASRVGVSEWWLLPKRRWLRPVLADVPVAQRFADLEAAVSFLEAPLAPRERGSGRPRPLMLAGVQWHHASGSPAVAAESMRLMIVPGGWARRAEAIAPAAGEGAERAEEAEGGAPGDAGGRVTA